MNDNCEIVGWVLVDDAAHVLVRTESEGQLQATLSTERTFEQLAIRTGSFRRNQLIDFVTRRVLVREAD